MSLCLRLTWLNTKYYRRATLIGYSNWVMLRHWRSFPVGRKKINLTRTDFKRHYHLPQNIGAGCTCKLFLQYRVWRAWNPYPVLEPPIEFISLPLLSLAQTRSDTAFDSVFLDTAGRLLTK